MDKELMEMIKQTLEFYANAEYRDKKECPATGLTIMQDDNGTRARSVLKILSKNDFLYSKGVEKP